MRENPVGCIWVVVFVVLAFVTVCTLPAQAAECVPYGSLCVPAYVVKYLPPEPPPDDPGASWGPLVAKYWPAHLHDWALAIIDCESRGDPGAWNPKSGAAGLFQFLESTWNRGPAPALGLPSYDSGAPYVAEWNIQAAAWLYENWGGRSQWSCKA